MRIELKDLPAAIGGECAEALGFSLEEIPEWQCCGGAFTTTFDEIATKLSSVRALLYAEENGGKLVDNSGYAVKIVDKDGNIIVDGTSPTRITVTGELSTSIKTSNANQIESTDIDRADFDAYFETDTAFGDESVKTAKSTPAGSASSASASVSPTSGDDEIDDETRASLSKDLVIGWFNNLS